MGNKINEGGSFCVINEIFDKNLSGNAKLVYTYLSRCADCFGKSWPAHKTIAAACSLSVTAVKTALAELQEEKLVTVTHKYRENGGKSSNLYMIMNKGYTNCFWVMSGVFSKGVSAKAKLVYMYFCRCSNQEGNCFPAHRTIAEKCVMALSTCRKAIKELLDAALIHINTRARKDNGQTSNLYTIVKSAIETVQHVVQKVVDTVAAMTEAAQKELPENEEKTDENEKIKEKNTLWPICSREHSHNIAGGVLKYAYERTKLKLRKLITKEYLLTEKEKREKKDYDIC